MDAARQTKEGFDIEKHRQNQFCLEKENDSNQKERTAKQARPWMEEKRNVRTKKRRLKRRKEQKREHG